MDFSKTSVVSEVIFALPRKHVDGGTVNVWSANAIASGMGMCLAETTEHTLREFPLFSEKFDWRRGHVGPFCWGWVFAGTKKKECYSRMFQFGTVACSLRMRSSFWRIIHSWTVQRVPNDSWRVSIYHPLGFTWHPLEGAGKKSKQLMPIHIRGQLSPGRVWSTDSPQIQ